MSRAAWTAAALALAAACSSTEPRIGESWELSLLDGAAPPFLYQGLPTDSQWVLAGTITVYEDGRWEARYEVRRKLNGVVTLDTLPYTGTYVFTGATVNADQFLYTANLPGGGTHQMDVLDTTTQLQVGAGLWATIEIYQPVP